MINTKFEAHKIKTELKRRGIMFLIQRHKINEFGEDIKSLEDIGYIHGIYHETNSSVHILTGDTTQTRTKKVPMILCLWDDTICLRIKANDIIFFNDKKFLVQGIVNVQEWNIIGDITLERVDDGF